MSRADSALLRLPVELRILIYDYWFRHENLDMPADEKYKILKTACINRALRCEIMTHIFNTRTVDIVDVGIECPYWLDPSDAHADWLILNCTKTLRIFTMAWIGEVRRDRDDMPGQCYWTDADIVINSHLADKFRQWQATFRGMTALKHVEVFTWGDERIKPRDFDRDVRLADLITFCNVDTFKLTWHGPQDNEVWTACQAEIRRKVSPDNR